MRVIIKLYERKIQNVRMILYVPLIKRIKRTHVKISIKQSNCVAPDIQFLLSIFRSPSLTPKRRRQVYIIAHLSIYAFQMSTSAYFMHFSSGFYAISSCKRYKAHERTKSTDDIALYSRP